MSIRRDCINHHNRPLIRAQNQSPFSHSHIRELYASRADYSSASRFHRKDIAVATLVEPRQLRLPRDILVLQPMHGHLDLDPMLLAPGSRCVIGAAAHCTARLTHSTLVHDEHCVIEVIGRKTLLTNWAHEATWLNDRLVTEPRELIAGDRVAIGPFDFRLRSALADELVSDQTGQSDAHDSEKKSAPKTTATEAFLDRELSTDLITELSRQRPKVSQSSAPELMTQHVSTLFGDLQSQVLLLQEKEAELNEQLQQRRESSATPDAPPRSAIVRAIVTTRKNSATSNSAVPQTPEVFWKKEAEEASAKLRAERDSLERDRLALNTQQTRYEELLQKVEQQQRELALTAGELESGSKTLQSEEFKLQQRAQQLSEKEEQLAHWESRLRDSEATLNRQQEELRWQTVDPVKPAVWQGSFPLDVQPSERRPLASPDAAVAAPSSQPRLSDDELNSHAHRPVQTFMTLIAFSLAAALLGIGIGDPEVSSLCGWTTAIIGAISTVDLLYRRWFAVM